MNKFPASSILWTYQGEDPHNTGKNKERPVIVVSHKNRPFNSVECTVMCLGHGSKNQNHRTPQLKPGTHYNQISFSKNTYLLPWSIHTIPPGALNPAKGVGQLTKQGKVLVGKEFTRQL